MSDTLVVYGVLGVPYMASSCMHAWFLSGMMGDGMICDGHFA